MGFQGCALATMGKAADAIKTITVAITALRGSGSKNLDAVYLIVFD